MIANRLAGTMTKSKTAPLEISISPELHAMIKRAAELEGRTVSDFVISASQRAAQKAIEQAEAIRLSLADQETFAKALITPPKPNAALKRAFIRGRKLIRD